MSKSSKKTSSRKSSSNKKKPHRLKPHYVIQLFIVIAVAIALFFPTWTTQVVSQPKAETKYIRRLHDDNTVGQTLQLTHKAQAIEIIVRREQPGLATIFIENYLGQQLGMATAEVTNDNSVPVRIPLDNTLVPGEHHLVFRTGADIPREQAVLVRYQSKSESYEEGFMTVNGEESYGDLGFKVFSRIPWWQAILLNRHTSVGAFQSAVTRTAFGLFIGALLITLYYSIERSKYHTLATFIPLAILGLFTIVLRVPYIAQLEGVFGGDPFNYLSKTFALLNGIDPFAADPRKGPFFSFLLVPGMFTGDPILWSRWVGIIATGIATVITAVIARAFKIPWGAAFGAGLLLAVNVDFIWEATNAMANTTFAALVVAAVLVYLEGHRKWAQLTLPVLVGLVFLTRFEGGLIGLLIPALWYRERLSWRRGVTISLIAIAIMMIPQLSFIWSGQSGVRTADDILSDEGLFVATSFEEFNNNLNRFYRFAATTWVPAKSITFVAPAFLIGLIIGGIITFARKREKGIPDSYWLLIAGLAAIAIATLVWVKSPTATNYLAIISWLLPGIGLIPFIKSRPYDAIILLVFLALYFVVITLILPKPRYYGPLIPILSICIAFGVRAMMRGTRPVVAHTLPLIFIGLLASTFYYEGRGELHDRVIEHNTKSTRNAPMIAAVKQLRRLGGTSAFRTGDEQPLFAYLKPDTWALYQDTSDTDAKTAQAELNWLAERGTDYIVERETGKVWQSARLHPELFSEPVTHDTSYSEAQVTIYKVDQSALQQHVLQ